MFVQIKTTLGEKSRCKFTATSPEGKCESGSPMHVDGDSLNGTHTFMRIESQHVQTINTNSKSVTMSG